jgi:hypothetical protein
MTSQQRMRVVKCPACEHEGAIPREVPTTAKLRCRCCGERSLIREATGPRPCRRHRSVAADMKAATAQNIIARYGVLPDDGDSLDDLWTAAPAKPP